MRTRRFQLSLAIVVILGVLAAMWTQSAEKKSNRVAVQNATEFLYPDYYQDDPKDLNKLKSLLQGKSAKPIPGERRWIVSGINLSTYLPDGTTNLILETPECVWDEKDDRATSTNQLSATRGGELFHIKGVGFSWLRTNSFLVVSNKVQTSINKKMFATTKPGEPDDGDMEITSDRFDFDYVGGLAVYTGNVTAADEHKKVRCQKLTVKFESKPNEPASVRTIHAEKAVEIELVQEDGRKAFARSENAFYKIEGETKVLEMDGVPRPTWKSEEYNGEGDRLTMHLTEHRFLSTGHSRVQFPRGASKPAADAAPMIVSVESNESDVRMKGKREAIFNGNVKTTDPRWKMSCDRMNATLFEKEDKIEKVLAVGNVVMEQQPLPDENGVVGEPSIYRAHEMTADFSPETGLPRKMVAQQNVRFDRGVQHAEGSRAFYTQVDKMEVVELSGNPSWKTDQAEGAADVLEFRGDLFQAHGNAVFRRKETAPQTAGTGPAAKTPSLNSGLFEASSDDYDYRVKDSQAVFRGHVHAHNAEVNLTCGLMRVFLDRKDNSFQRLEAEQKVDVKRGEHQATCEKMIYTAANDSIELRGKPVILVPRFGPISGSVLIWNLATDKVRGWDYSITFDSSIVDEPGKASEPAVKKK